MRTSFFRCLHSSFYVAIFFVLITWISSASAVSYPSTTPPNESSGGTFNTYFTNMYGKLGILDNPLTPTTGCPYGLVVRGFTNTGMLLCASKLVDGKGNYPFILSYAYNETPANGIKIKTNIPYADSIGMPTIIIQGFDYHGGQTIGLLINWYVWAGNFYSASSMSSYGGYTPVVKLANEGGKIVIFIEDKRYYTRFTVSAYDYGIAAATPTMYEGWSAADEPLTGTNVYTLPYKNNFAGRVGVGTMAPQGMLHVSVGAGLNGIVVSKDGGYNSEGNNAVRLVDSSYGTALQMGADPANNIGYIQAMQPWASWSTRNLILQGNGGNVGIGTTNPQAKLDVNGDMKVGDIWGGVAGGTRAIWKFDNNWPNHGIFYTERNPDFIDFSPNGGGTGSSVMRVSGNGNVGIGTSTPQAKLEIGTTATDSGTTQAIFSRGADVNFQLQAIKGWSTNVIGSRVGALGIRYNGGPSSPFPNGESALINFYRGVGSLDGKIGLSTNGVDRLFVENNGNVGIGTSTPQANLEVRRDGDFQAAQYVMNGGTGPNSSAISLVGEGGGGKYGYLGYFNNSYVPKYGWDTPNTTVVSAQGAGGLNLSSLVSDMRFFTNGANERMRISKDGNVGIGTTDPQTKLDVRGSAFLGSADINKGIKLTDGWTGYPNTTMGSEISNDTTNYKTLMIIGNRSNNGSTRRVSIWDELNVNGTTNANGPLNVGGPTTINNSLSVSGVTTLNNVFINGDTVIGSGHTIGFVNPNDVPWMPRSSNLPFVKFGGLKYIKPQILGSFNGQVIESSARAYYLYEPDGTLVGLREGYNGEYQGLYYMYSVEGKSDAMTLTTMEYRPAFIEGTDWHITKIIDSTKDSMTVQMLNAAGNQWQYRIITHIDTLDPSTHTADKIIDITDNTMFPSKACNYISERNMIACVSGAVTRNLYLYTLDANNNATKVNLYNTRQGGYGDGFFDMNNAFYFQKTGPISAYSINWGGIQRESLQYEIQGNNLYIQTIMSLWLPLDSGGGGKTITVNLIYRVDLANNYVYYENTLPLKYNWSANTNDSGDVYSILPYGTDIYWVSFKPQFFKAKNQVIISAAQWDGYIKTWRFDSVPSFLSYFKGMTGWGFLNIGGTNYTHIAAQYMPYDASYLGKSLSHTRFLGPNSIMTLATSNKFLESYTTKWVQLGLPNSSITRTVQGTPALSLPTSITDLSSSNKVNLNQSTLDAAGNIVSYYIAGNQIYKYNSSNDILAPHVTLPANFMTQVNAQIAASATYSAYPLLNLGDPRIRILNDNLILVPYLLAYDNPSTPLVDKIVYNYILFSYNAGGLTPIKRVENYWSQTDGALSTGYSSPDTTSYIAANGDIYAMFISHINNTSGGNYMPMPVIRMDASGNRIASTVYYSFSSWHTPTIGIHPSYGPYWTNSFDDTSTKAKMYCIDNTSIGTLSTRITQSFNDLVYGSKGWGPTVMTTVRQAEGFILYTSDTPIFVDGVYTKLTNNSYNLSDPVNGLVTTMGDTASLKNKTIYAYIDPAKGTVTPTLSFSFSEPNKSVVAILTTGTDGLTNILVKDGLSIISDNVYVRRINVSSHIEMRAPNGQYYKVYVDNSGSLRTQLIIQ